MAQKEKPESSVVQPTLPEHQERRRGIRRVAAVAAAAVTVAATLRVRHERRKSKRAGRSEERERLTVKLPASLIDHARNAVFWSPGLTLTALVEECLLRGIARLERKRGEAFGPRTADLKAGRPSAK